MGYIHHSKNPNICSWRMSSMGLIVPITKCEYTFKSVLNTPFLYFMTKQGFINLHHMPRTSYYQRGITIYESPVTYIAEVLVACHLRDLCLLSSISNWVPSTPQCIKTSLAGGRVLSWQRNSLLSVPEYFCK